jgi:hypothetical protein
MLTPMVSEQPELAGNVPEVIPQDVLRHVALEVTLNEQALAENIRRDVGQSSSVHSCLPMFLPKGSERRKPTHASSRTLTVHCLISQ